MVKVTRYEFDGELLSAGQISKPYPAYSPSTVALACSEPNPCKSLADLQARDLRGRANVRKAGKANASRMPPIVLKPSDKSRAARQDAASMGLRS